MTNRLSPPDAENLQIVNVITIWQPSVCHCASHPVTSTETLLLYPSSPKNKLLSLFSRENPSEPPPSFKATRTPSHHHGRFNEAGLIPFVCVSMSNWESNCTHKGRVKVMFVWLHTLQARVTRMQQNICTWCHCFEIVPSGYFKQ